jgi:WD40 repeat protein
MQIVRSENSIRWLKNWSGTLKSSQGKALQRFNNHNNTVSSAAFSPDGKAILTGSWDKTARLWISLEHFLKK